MFIYRQRFFLRHKGKKWQKKRNKTWKIGKNAHVTKEYNFNYGSTLQSTTIKLRLGAVSPRLAVLRSERRRTLCSYRNQWISFALFFLSNTFFSMNILVWAVFSYASRRTLIFQHGSVCCSTFVRKSKILALVFSRLDLIKYSFHLIRWKFSVWLVTEKHLFHNDGRVSVRCESGQTETWINSFFISSGANTHKAHSHRHSSSSSGETFTFRIHI